MLECCLSVVCLSVVWGLSRVLSQRDRDIDRDRDRGRAVPRDRETEKETEKR